MAEKTPVEQLTYKQASQELELIIRSLESGDIGARGVARELYPRRRAPQEPAHPPVRCRAEGLGASSKDVDGNDVLADGEAANTDDNLSF